MQLELPRAARYGSSRQQGRYDAAETGFGPDCKDRQVLRSPVLSSDGKILFVISGSGDSVVRVDSATGQRLGSFISLGTVCLTQVTQGVLYS